MQVKRKRLDLSDGRVTPEETKRRHRSRSNSPSAKVRCMVNQDEEIDDSGAERKKDHHHRHHSDKKSERKKGGKPLKWVQEGI